MRKIKEKKEKEYENLREDLDHEYYLQSLEAVYRFEPTRDDGCYYCRDIERGGVWHGECRGLDVFEGWMDDYCDARWLPGGANYWEPTEPEELEELEMYWGSEESDEDDE